MTGYRCAVVSALILAFSGSAAAQQHILFDQAARAGELRLFRDLNEEKTYYYVPDQTRLATDANGRPQFSFLRYTENKPATDGGKAGREGEGGGIVHAVISLSVSREQILAAERELQRKVPGARIKGPVAFTSGAFALVSSFKGAAGGLGVEVVCTGKAPILDGQNVAFSMQLTKLGSKVLWESFHTAAPDIAFAFEMQVEGYNSPKRGRIEANWDAIYQHRAFAAGVASKYLGAEIKAAFDDLVRSGGIKVIEIGADANLHALLDSAYEDIRKMMFADVTQPSTAVTDAEGALSRATKIYQDNAKNAIDERAKTRTENDDARKHNAELEKRLRAAEDAGRIAREKRQRADKAGTHLESLRQQVTEAESELAKLTTETPEGAEPPARLAAIKDRATRLRTAFDEAAKTHAAAETYADAAESTAAAARADAPTESEYLRIREEPSTGGGVALIATYEMKKTRQSGRYTVDLSQFTSETKSLPFEKNIGDLRSLINDTAHFRNVNLDDPLYRQREIAVFVDGLNAEDFGQYINFVTVQMRKRHAGGDLTLQEVRIDRTTFNRDGNHFGLLYGWKNDKDRERWFEYQYRLIWSFFGGISIEGPWNSSAGEALHVAPPFQRASVEVQGDPDAAKKAGVLAVTVRIFYTVAGVEKSKTVTLNATKNQLAGKVDFMLPNGSSDYVYEIVWQLAGNRTVSSGRRPSSTAVLFVDDMPAS